MKEFEFIGVPGTENINIPTQLDTFENVQLSQTRDGSFGPIGKVYDFSVAPGSSDSINLYNAFYLEYGNTFDKVLENAELMVNGDINYTKPISSYELDITGERNVPYFNANSTIYAGVTSQQIPTPSLLNTDNAMTYFRSGYVEFSIKTEKQNCVITTGDSEFVAKWDSNQYNNVNTIVPLDGGGSPVSIDSNNSYLTEPFTSYISSIIKIKNGKLNLSYLNRYGTNKNSFEILGNRNIADGQWHHIVVNFVKPGTIRDHGKKYNNRAIEFWVDGQLDQINTEYVNNSQVMFPVFHWLMMDPAEIAMIDRTTITNDVDGDWWYRQYMHIISNGNAPTNLPELTSYSSRNLMRFNNFGTRNFENALANAFKGSFNTFAHELNAPLTKFAIKERFKLWSGNDKNSVKLFVATANMMSPTVSTNKKKALKLFWNNLINDRAKNGIELDSNYQVDSYSITHKLLNSPTEVNNIDLASNKPIKYLPDVRVVVTENVLIWGPGQEAFYNLPYIPYGQPSVQTDPNIMSRFDSYEYGNANSYNTKFRTSAYRNLYFSGVELVSGDRILLTNQIDPKYNGIYIFQSMSAPLIRAIDANSSKQLNNAVVRITDGYYANTSWMMSSSIASLNDAQKWIELEFHPTQENINSQPFYGQRWSKNTGETRFINLEEDIDISKYDLVVFMNYPDNNNEIDENLVGYDAVEVKQKYEEFLKSLINVVSGGANLYVSAKKLAEDLGVVNKFESISQLNQDSDSHSAEISPFEIVEPAEKYYDTHRINQYSIQTEITGLTDKETYILTDFVSYVPDNNYDYEQYHAKYSYRQFGLKEGNEFIIPGLTLRSVTENKNLPGYRQNQKDGNNILAVKVSDINAGTIVAGLSNTYYNGSTIQTNPYDDYATIIVIHNGQQLNGIPINGKIFINCTEDGYTFSREEYNKAIIQIIPNSDVNENVSTRAWQYSTSRLNRKPQRIDIRQLTSLGQTTPTNGGGGPLIQAPSNTGNGVIRSATDHGNKNYQSDLYPTESEEIYITQEIPVLSMTWLGLQWLAE